jgi:hypothetical protein
MQVYFAFIFIDYIYLQKSHRFSTYISTSNTLIVVVPRPRCVVSEMPSLTAAVNSNTDAYSDSVQRSPMRSPTERQRSLLF